MAADHESVSLVVKEYQYNMSSFFVESIRWELFTQANTTLMKQIIEYSAKVKNHSKEGKFLHSLTYKKTSKSFWWKLFGCLFWLILNW